MDEKAEDARSEQGFFVGTNPTEHGPQLLHEPSVQEGIVRDVPITSRGWGKGVVPRDLRKFRYDVDRARSQPALSFSATKSDRMDAADAGDLLDRIHKLFGIDRQDESRILAFDKALWLEHTINGASLAQPGRGVLTVDGTSFDISLIKDLLGVDQRRFFRAFADDIAAVNQEVLDAFDPYDHESVEKCAFIKQEALKRGLQKYPHLAHDSSEACTLISMEARTAVMNSKRTVIPSSANAVDYVRPRVSRGNGGPEGSNIDPRVST